MNVTDLASLTWTNSASAYMALGSNIFKLFQMGTYIVNIGYFFDTTTFVSNGYYLLLEMFRTDGIVFGAHKIDTGRPNINNGI